MVAARRPVFAIALLLSACGAGAIDGEWSSPDGGGDPLPLPDARSPAPVGDAGAWVRPDAGPMPTAESGGTIDLPECGYSVTTHSGATTPWFPPDNAARGTDPTPFQVHLGIAGDAARSMVILWRTVDNSTLPTSVRFGVHALDEARWEGFTFSFRSGSASDSTRIRMHEAHLCGLQPDTSYRYQVGAEGAWSPEYSFRTAPDARVDPSAQVSIAVLGDSRGGQSTFASLLAAAQANAAPDVIFFTGDAVSSGVGQEEWDSFFNLASGMLPYVPLVHTNGNHESNAVNFYSQLAMPGNEEWFGLDYGPVHLTVLNDSPSSSATIAGVQRSFFEQDAAAAASAPWRFAMHHRSMFSASEHGSTTSLQTAWGPVVDAQGIDLVLSGHDHDYERTKILRAGQPAATGTLYLVAGGAGAPLYRSGTQPFTAFSESRRHYVILDVRAGRVDGRAYRDDGTLMDRFTLTK